MSFNRKEQRNLRHMRLRQRVIGSADRPRMSICVSNKHMYVQFIDDAKGTTLASASTLKEKKANLEIAKALGASAASAAKAKGIVKVVIDRGGNPYTGRVAAIVESAVANGLSISDKPAKPVQAPAPKAAKPAAAKAPKAPKAPKAAAPAQKEQKHQEAK